MHVTERSEGLAKGVESCRKRKESGEAKSGWTQFEEIELKYCKKADIRKCIGLTLEKSVLRML
jgi:hypothetical protein